VRPSARTACYAALIAWLAVVAWFAATQVPYDLNVYLWGGRAVAHDARLYLAQVDGHWFTYPPFAALVFASLAKVPAVAARLCWEFGSIAACAVACALTLKLAGWRVSRAVLAGTVASALALEPMYHTLYLGQVNLILFALVLGDVWLVSRGRPAAGIGVGIAAAVKLVPGIFVILFLLAGRTRAALTATVTFACCGLAAYLVAPGASRLYWSQLFFDTNRVGAPYISSQSLYAAAVRISGGAGRVGIWYPLLALVIGVVGLATAAVLARHGDWLAGAAAAATTGLLVSPISWTHHWVAVLPALVVLAREGARGRIAAACGYLLFVLAPMWWTPHGGGQDEYGFHGVGTLVANCFLLAGLAMLGYLAVRAGAILRIRRPALPRDREVMPLRPGPEVVAADRSG
jgi:alpha-1,2-mannosyltransferase